MLQVITTCSFSDLSLDCEERQHLCANGAFHEIMLDRCPRTCNLCQELLARKSVEEEEEETPQTSVEEYETKTTTPSEITEEEKPVPESLAELLSLSQLVGSAERYIPDLENVDAIYANSVSRKHAKPAQCRDFATDCYTKVRLCENIFYSRIMERFCQKTCGFCGSSPFRKRVFKKIKTPFSSRKTSKKSRSRGRVRGTAAVTTACLDLGVDCNEKRTLCNHKSYTTLMKRMCPKTCNLCDSS